MTTTDQKRLHVFSCGSQAVDWQCSNCDRCKKNAKPNAMPTCEIQLAMGEAAWGDGGFSPEMARRIGFIGNEAAFQWKCPEVEWTEEWKAEWRRRRTWRYRTRRFVTQRWRRIRNRVVKFFTDRRERRRLALGEKMCFGEGKTGCWADWVCWALGHGDERPDREGDTDAVCRTECGGCYCGKHRGAK